MIRKTSHIEIDQDLVLGSGRIRLWSSSVTCVFVVYWIELMTSVWPAGSDAWDGFELSSSKSSFVNPKGTSLRGVPVGVKRSAWKKNEESCLSV